MYPNLEAEQARLGHTEQYVAQKLGMSVQKYLTQKKSGTFQLSEALALAAMYNKPIEYLFQRKDVTRA